MATANTASKINLNRGFDSQRGAALLVLAGPPTSDVLVTMVACAQNLGRNMEVIAIGERSGGVVATDPEIAQAAAAKRRIGAAVIVVASGTPPPIVRRLATAARCPVLVARTRQRWEVVLSATDLNARGLPVVVAGSAIAERCHARSLVIHNVSPSWAVPTPNGEPIQSAIVSRRVRRLVRAAAHTTPRSGVMVSNANDAQRAITRAVVERDADLLVLGMRRPTHHLLGGCADGILATTPGNVMVVPLGRAGASSSSRSAVQP